MLLAFVDVLRQLYGRVVIPSAVFRELTAEGSPAPVAAWIRGRPEWIEVREEGNCGEAESLLLIDDAAGRAVASRLGMANTGTLGLLVAAAREGLVDLGVMLDRLQQTNFRVGRR